MNKNPKSKGNIEVAEVELLKNFINYWKIRKAIFSRNSSALINEAKGYDSNTWFHLIESNHKFREKYGEETAKKIIESME